MFKSLIQMPKVPNGWKLFSFLKTIDFYGLDVYGKAFEASFTQKSSRALCLRVYEVTIKEKDRSTLFSLSFCQLQNFIYFFIKSIDIEQWSVIRHRLCEVLLLTSNSLRKRQFCESESRNPLFTWPKKLSWGRKKRYLSCFKIFS